MMQLLKEFIDHLEAEALAEKRFGLDVSPERKANYIDETLKPLLKELAAFRKRRATSRFDVYGAIDSERDYQDSRWNENTTTSNGFHEIEEWLVFIDDYLTEAKHVASRLPRQDSNPMVLASLRKVAAMCVCAMEQHGAPRR